MWFTNTLSNHIAIITISTNTSIMIINKLEWQLVINSNNNSNNYKHKWNDYSNN